MDLLRQILYVIIKNPQETEWNMIISQNGDRSQEFSQRLTENTKTEEELKTIGFEFIFTNIIY